MDLHAKRPDGGAPTAPEPFVAPPLVAPPRTGSPAVPPPGASAGERRESRVLYVLLAVLALSGGLARPDPGAVGERLLAVLLAVAATGAAVVVHTHAARLDRAARRPWRVLSVVVVLLAAGRLLNAVDGAVPSAVAHVPQVFALPLALAACLLLLPTRGGRAGLRELLDGAIVVVAVVLFAGLVLSRAGARSGSGVVGVVQDLGYPAGGALLCAVALVAVSRTPASRRRPAVWLMVSMVATAVLAIAAAMARGLGEATSDLLISVAWSAMLAAAVRAVDTDPGYQPRGSGAADGLPLFGLAVSHATAYGVAGVVIAVLNAGHTFTGLEQVALGVFILCTSLRSLLWVVDGGRLTRRLQQTEAYFSALAASAEDVTVVLDDGGRVRWVSGAADGQLGWSARDLTGRRLADLLDPADHGVLDRVVGTRAAVPTGLPPTVRLRTRDGNWRDVELSGVARAGVPGAGLREGLVLHLRDVTARRSGQRELERLAYTDHLTGLPNRARFLGGLEAARTHAAEGRPSCVLLVDLDGFKAVNDVAGHEAGDQLLIQVADQLRAGAREQDLVARLGGDEFAILVPAGLGEATGLAERLVEVLDRSFQAPSPDGSAAGPRFPVSGSIGLAELDPADDVSATVRQADLALRAAKAAGKRCVRSSGEGIDAAVGRRARLARDLPAALAEGQLQVLYQPVVGVHDRRVLGLEALVRWEHPLLGAVPPAEFIPLAEEDGLTVPLQRWVLGVATEHAAVLLADGWDVQMGVNVSVRHIQAGCLAPDVAAALTAAQLPAGKLILEITESVLLEVQDRVLSDLETLRGMGVVLSLDDFGAGWSSLAYLARLPVQILKMDRVFVAGIESDPRGRALVASVVELGRTLGMDVVAEGVETEGQMAQLRAMGCRYLQGYLFGRPMPFADLRALLASFDDSILDVDDPGTRNLDPGVHLVGRDG